VGPTPSSYFGRDQYQLADDLDMVRGANHLVFGGEAIVLQMNSATFTFGNGESNILLSLPTMKSAIGLLDNEPLKANLATRAIRRAIGNEKRYFPDMANGAYADVLKSPRGSSSSRGKRSFSPFDYQPVYTQRAAVPDTR
jgi:hypothetical protein